MSRRRNDRVLGRPLCLCATYERRLQLSRRWARLRDGAGSGVLAAGAAGVVAPLLGWSSTPLVVLAGLIILCGAQQIFATRKLESLVAQIVQMQIRIQLSGCELDEPAEGGGAAEAGQCPLLGVTGWDAPDP